MTITLIVPIYNKAPFLRRCLDSIANQTVPFDQVILIDDNSTDESLEIALKYANSNDWGLIMKSQNAGVSKCRNLGIGIASSDYICFLDADDALKPNASEIMHKYAEKDKNIIQFGQERHHSGGLKFRMTTDEREWRIPTLPKYWQMVWNKLFKREFLEKHEMRFDENMTFGEDEIFCADAIMANKGELWHAPHILVEHYLDDSNSICRGGRLKKADFRKLDDELLKRANRTRNMRNKSWLEHRSAELNGTRFYHKHGVNRKGEGKHDIVYFLRDGSNEELRYSLRSVDENFAYNKIWFVGGKPENISPDEYMSINQTGMDKFERVRNMLLKCCRNDNITEEFWLFNDDFFVMLPSLDDTQWTNGTLQQRILNIEAKENAGMPTAYSQKLRHLVRTLEKDGLPTLNYAVHKPMLINRKKMLETLEKYPHEPMFRALYGNYWHIKAKDDIDCKIRRCDRPLKPGKQFISTSDLSFNHGIVGAQLRERFKYRSRFEE